MKILLIHPRYEVEEVNQVTQSNMREFLDKEDQVLTVDLNNDLSELSKTIDVLNQSEMVVFNYDYEIDNINKLLLNICKIYDKPFEILDDYRVNKIQKAIDYIDKYITNNSIAENIKRILTAYKLRLTGNIYNLDLVDYGRLTNPNIDYNKLKRYINDNFINVQAVLNDLKVPISGIMINWEVTDNTFTIICNKQYNSLDNTIRTTINKHCKKLEKQLIDQSISKIFNNPSITYKKYNDGFFAYKIAGNYQIRLLFKYIDKLELHKIYVKNGRQNTFDDEYLKLFKNYIDNYI